MSEPLKEWIINMDYEQIYRDNDRKELPDFLTSKKYFIQELNKLLSAPNNFAVKSCQLSDKVFKFEDFYTDKVFELIFDENQIVIFICGSKFIKYPIESAKYLLSFVGK